MGIAALLYHQTERTALYGQEAEKTPHSISTLFMRLYTGNRGGAKERRFFFAPEPTSGSVFTPEATGNEPRTNVR